MTLEATGKEDSFRLMDPVFKSTIVISRKDGLARSITDHSAEGSLYQSVTLSNLKFDTGLEPGTFKYVPPEGAKVMDMTEQVKAMMREGNVPKD